MKEALLEMIGEELSKAALYSSTDAAALLRLPIARFQELAEGIPTVKFGRDHRKNWYRLHDLVELVERHKFPPKK